MFWIAKLSDYALLLISITINFEKPKVWRFDKECGLDQLKNKKNDASQSL